MAGAFSKHRFQIWNRQQHPYKHSAEEFAYLNDSTPGVSNLKQALDYILSILYPLTQASVPLKTDLPEGATFVATPGATTVITTTGDKYYTDDQVLFETTGALPTGLAVSTIYYLLETAPNTYELYSDKNRTVPVSASDMGTGVHSVVNLPGSYRVVLDDGDGKAAAYRWQQLESEALPTWHKVGDLDWGQDSVLAAFQNITQDLYVSKLGKDDYDEAGLPLVGDLAGQHIYGGASANTNLILHANAGDGTGPQTGEILVSDSVAPLSVGLSLGSLTKMFQDLWLANQAHVDTMTLGSGSITDSTGDISFDNENLTTTGSVTAESLDVNSATIGNMTLQNSQITSTDPAVDFGTNNLTTTGSVTASSLVATGGVETMTVGEASIGSSTGAIDFNANDLNNVGAISATSLDVGSLTIDDLTLDNNTVSSLTDVNISPAVGSKVLLNKDTDVTGNLDVTGDITGNTLSDGKTVLNGTNISSTDGFVDVDSLKVLRAGDAEFVDVKATTLTSPTSASENIEDIVAFPFTGANEGDTIYYNSGAWVAQPRIDNDTTDHGSLSGLGDDDHTQYALLAGRAGGQELVGGALGTETLTLKSNATGANEILTKDNVAPFTGASYSGGWQGTDLGTLSLPFRDIYTKGELKGARAENVGSLPSANVTNAGRVVFNTANSSLYYDIGGAWSQIVSGAGVTVIANGGSLSGTYNTHILCEGDVSLGGNTVINGCIYVKGNFTNTSGYTLTVNGDLLTVGHMDFSSIGAGGDVTINGNCTIGESVVEDITMCTFSAVGGGNSFRNYSGGVSFTYYDTILIKSGILTGRRLTSRSITSSQFQWIESINDEISPTVSNQYPLSGSTFVKATFKSLWFRATTTPARFFVKKDLKVGISGINFSAISSDYSAGSLVVSGDYTGGFINMSATSSGSGSGGSLYINGNCSVTLDGDGYTRDLNGGSSVVKVHRQNGASASSANAGNGGNIYVGGIYTGYNVESIGGTGSATGNGGSGGNFFAYAIYAGLIDISGGSTSGSSLYAGNGGKLSCKIGSANQITSIGGAAPAGYGGDGGGLTLYRFSCRGSVSVYGGSGLLRGGATSITLDTVFVLGSILAYGGNRTSTTISGTSLNSGLTGISLYNVTATSDILAYGGNNGLGSPGYAGPNGTYIHNVCCQNLSAADGTGTAAATATVTIYLTGNNTIRTLTGTDRTGFSWRATNLAIPTILKFFNLIGKTVLTNSGGTNTAIVTSGSALYTASAGNWYIHTGAVA